MFFYKATSSLKGLAHDAHTVRAVLLNFSDAYMQRQIERRHILLGFSLFKRAAEQQGENNELVETEGALYGCSSSAVV